LLVTTPNESRVQWALRELGMLTVDPAWVRSTARRPKVELTRFVGAPRVNGHVLGRVYFAQATPGGLVKIGWAVDVRRRVIQVASERSLPGLRPLTSVKGIRIDEGRVHRAVNGSRAAAPGREWFQPTDGVRCVVEAFGGKLL
jgi:hypothetical protein